MDEISLETLERARSGNPEAYRELVTAYERPVYHTVFRLVGARFPADVDDITQDIFVKLFRNLPLFDPTRGTKLSSWVFTFVKNYCFDVLKRKRLKTVPLDSGSDENPALDLPSGELEPSDRLVSAEVQATIARAVDELPNEQKAAFVLREYQGLTYADIAQITETSEGTVKSRIHRAKEALRFRLRRLVMDSEGGVT